MKAIVQLVSEASVVIKEQVKGSIQKGLLILLGVAKGDTRIEADILAAKIANLRIFKDEQKKMNLSLLDVEGGALVVSNFTLCADCSHGRRPSFTDSAQPETANELYEYFLSKLLALGIQEVASGEFGAEMEVVLTNNGPVTIYLDSMDLSST